MKRDGMNEEDAMEFFSYNIAGEYNGSGMPIFLFEYHDEWRQVRTDSRGEKKRVDKFHSKGLYYRKGERTIAKYIQEKSDTTKRTES